MELAVVKQYLTENGVVFTDKDAETALLKVVISSDFRVNPAARRHAAQLITEFNWAQQEGCAEMDLRDGELRFRFSFPITGATPEVIRKITELCIAKSSPLWTKLANAVHDFASQTSGGRLDDAKLKYYLGQATA